MFKINLDRYYNRFDSQPQFKDYKQLLFRAGDALQSSEVNEIFSTLKNDLGNLADRFMKNGEFISGGNVTTELIESGALSAAGEKLYNIKVVCESGISFINSNFVNVSSSELILNDQLIVNSDFRIGILLEYSIIDPSIDPSLKDPAIETMNFNQEGARRLKITGTWIFENDFQENPNVEFLPLYRIRQGDIYDKYSFNVDNPGDKNSIIESFNKNVTNIVAKYDRNANGNYLINGYEVEFIERVPQLISDNGTPNITTDNIYAVNQLGPYKFSVADGNANVNGYNYQKDVNQEIELESLIDFELKQSEPINFTGDDVYYTRHFPIRKVFRISGQKRESSRAIQHGNFSGATDELPNSLQPVIEIESVWQTGTETAPDFTYGVDYVLDGDSVKWLGTANEPIPGSTYYVTFRYQYTEVEGNFSVGGTQNLPNGDISSQYNTIYLHGFAPGTTVNIDYDFVLKRIDIIFLDASGKLGYVKGVPHEDDPRAPTTDKELVLDLAEVLLSGDLDPSVTLSGKRVFEMSHIQSLLDAIRQNEYNITRMALQQNIQETQPGANLKGQFVDTFDDDNHRDLGLESELLSTNGDYRAMTIGGNLIMDISWETQNLVSSTILPDEKMSIEMPPIYNQISVISQPHVTKFRKINEYLFKSPPSAKITISPSVYRWVTETHYRSFVRQVQTATRTINSFTTRFGFFGTLRWNWNLRNTTTTSVSRQVLNSSVNRTSYIQQSRTPSIIPRINVGIHSDYNDYNQNEQVKIYFDNKYSTTLTATNGRIEGVFQVPENMISGSKEVKAIGVDSGVIGTTLFKAEPLSRTIQTSVTNWWRWVVRRQGTTWWSADPVSQSFSMNKTISLDRIKIVFQTLPTTPVSCVVCETTAGYPDKNKALISKTLNPSELEPAGVIQDFIFDNKVVLTKGKEYAFIIICKDSVGSVQVAKLGERTIDSPQQWLTEQAYSVGTLFNSSNNSTWTPIQTEDMRFWIHECTFETNYEHQFDPIYVTNATDLMVFANAKVYEGCNIKYRLELLDRPNGDTYLNNFLENAYSQIPLGSIYTGRVKLTAVFNSNGLFTPVLDPNIQISVGNSKKKSTYISTGFTFDPTVAKVSVLLDNYRPSNTTINVQVQIFSDTKLGTYSWENMVQDTNSTPLGNDWVETKFIFDWNAFQSNPNNVGKFDTVNPQNIMRVRIDLYTTNDKNRAVISNLRLNTLNI